MAEPVHQKYGFDTVFDGAGDVTFAAARPKRLYTAEEVEEIRKRAFSEGEIAAASTAASIQSAALDIIAGACRQALPRLAEVAHEHRVGSAELAQACARAIADAALARFPQAPVQAALEGLAREIEASPRLIVTAPAEVATEVEKLLNETAQAVGFPGAIMVRPRAGMSPGAFTLDFGDGVAAFDPDEAAGRVAAALAAALASEGLHAEPLIPAGES